MDKLAKPLSPHINTRQTVYHHEKQLTNWGQFSVSCLSHSNISTPEHKYQVTPNLKCHESFNICVTELVVPLPVGPNQNAAGANLLLDAKKELV